MTLNKNIFANVTGVAVTTILTFLVVPFYLKWLGPDAYGLVGISTMIQGWIMLLNAGLAPVAGRQAAQAQQGAVSWENTVRFFRTIDWLLIAASVLVIVLTLCTRYWIADHWLEKNNLGSETVATSLVLLVAMTLIRLATSVSRGIIANLERQVWLNVNLIMFNLLRFAASLPLLYFYPTISALFIWWLLVAVLEYASIQYKIICSVPVTVPLFAFDVGELIRHGRMAAALAFTSGIWVVVTNFDKLLLSGMLTLANYGYFSIATMLASGVLTLAQPVAQAFQPRLTKAYSAGGVDRVCQELRHCTQWMVLLVFPVGAVIFAMPEAVLFIWTHDATLATNAATILRGYVLGSIMIASGSLLYVMQVAIGNVRWHFIGNIVFALILIPSLPWVVSRYGAQGAAWLWAGFNLVLYVVWNSILLKKLAAPLFPGWLLYDTATPMLISIAMALGFKAMFQAMFADSMSNFGSSVVGIVLIIMLITALIFAALWTIAVKRNLMRSVA